MTFRRSIYIDAPVERVFDFFKDPGNWREFESPAVITDVVLTPEGTGTRYRWEARLAGLRIAGLNTFTEVVPNTRITDESSRSFEGTWTYSFEREGTGTRVTMENRQTSFWRIPPLSQLMDFLAGGHERVLSELKARLEA